MLGRYEYRENRRTFLQTAGLYTSLGGIRRSRKRGDQYKLVDRQF